MIKTMGIFLTSLNALFFCVFYFQKDQALNELGFILALIGICSAIYLGAIGELGQKFKIKDEYINLCLSTVSVISGVSTFFAFCVLIYGKNPSLIGIPVFYSLFYLFTAWRIEWCIREQHKSPTEHKNSKG